MQRKFARPATSYKLLAAGSLRGVTLLDTVVGTALMLVIFLGIAAVFQLAVDVVTNNKARGGALALANERMEYIRSLSYTSIGTVGGIPAGAIAQSETVVVNGVTHTRRTVVVYGDDPKDGTGAADSNGIVEDYKIAKVDVAWVSRNGTRHLVLVSRFESLSGMEITCAPCGTLTIHAVNAASQPLPGASVSIENAAASPAISIHTFTNESGTAQIIGAPVASGYSVVVTKPGFSTARTYSVTSQNTNPNPSNLTVANNQTTTGTFAIDVLGTKSVNTWTQILPGTWTDTFTDSSNIATSASTTVTAGSVRLTGSSGSYPALGNFQSITISPASLNKWKTFTASISTPAQTGILFRFYDGSGSTPIPDSVLPGNSAGFAISTVSLLNVSTSTYPSIRIMSELSSNDPAVTPSIDSYSVLYDYGPDPLPNIAFTLRGDKTIGSGPSGVVYKYSQNLNSGAGASVSTSTLEWDTYTITVNGTSTAYDIASSCASPQPETILPAASQTTNLFLAAHTVNSLLVDVRSSATSALIEDATVVLSRTGFAATSTTDTCGQAFFGGLTSASTTVKTSAAGYTTKTQSGVSVGGTSQLSVTLN
ncbi:hypothetical protein A2851_00065 [Candidatus Kaiserbacteria bacterium RIFCSPHIGHO2_01_FULL_53_29]|uniref:Carboxypeptidase regulatory-like domain-containing protein n=1 Tax=Candidatus Kaiserbacteria bacterium RIFCSPHIGHO2_01_FULL_53_29 TaxID=1798480 RepID=A0A1F6CWB3_9BACT|nr:MAG: hypothetical protein A2851_00065 [Candidatus Kaiserbacteria bacterium RIFCSPHIGHO2_01_FULL_53_29]